MQSQNGFPVLSAGSPKLHKWIIPGTKRHFYMRNGSAGFLLAHIALWYHEKVDRLDGGIWDEWGYAFRPIRGSDTTYSNHASGTAIDVDATQWPLGTTNMPRLKKIKIRARLKLYRGAIRWGGNYAGRKDEMHFEIDKSLSACERVAMKLMNTPRGKRILKANPGQEQVIKS
jgi:hypothetical protein